MQLKPINQQVVAIVGASSGIGRETALDFAKRGAKVVVSARSESGLKSLVDEIQSFGGEATAITPMYQSLSRSERSQIKQSRYTDGSILGYTVPLSTSTLPLSRQRQRSLSASSM